MNYDYTDECGATLLRFTEIDVALLLRFTDECGVRRDGQIQTGVRQAEGADEIQRPGGLSAGRLVQHPEGYRTAVRGKTATTAIINHILLF